MSRDMVGWNPGRGSSSRNKMCCQICFAQKISLPLERCGFTLDAVKPHLSYGRYLRYQGDLFGKTNLATHIISRIPYLSRDMAGWNPSRGSSSRNEMCCSLISSIREMWLYSACTFREIILE